MKRILLISIGVAFCSLIVGTAEAVEFSFLGPTSATVLQGEEITLSMVVTNDSRDSINTLGASVYGYGDNEFIEGAAVGSFFNSVCVAPGTCFGGFSNYVQGAGYGIQSLSESALGSSEDRVAIVFA